MTRLLICLVTKYLTKCFYSFYVIDTTPAYNHLCFRKNLLEKNIKMTMAIHDKIYNEKLQYDINKEAAKTPALSLGKIDKYE